MHAIPLPRSFAAVMVAMGVLAATCALGKLAVAQEALDLDDECGLIQVSSPAVQLRQLRASPSTSASTEVLAVHGSEASLLAEDLPFQVLPLQSDFVQGLIRRAGYGRSQQQARAAQGPRKPYLWLHIHKAGGSFMCQMAGTAGEHIVDPNDNCNWHGHDGYPDSGHPERGVTCEERVAHFREHGFTWGAIERELWPSDLCPDDFDYGVMLREPLALIISMMNFEPDVNREFYEDARAAVAERRPGEPGQHEHWKIVDNYQTRLLANAWEVPAGQVNASHASAARAFLEEHFQVVQRLEDMPINGSSLFQRLGWPDTMTELIQERVNPSEHIYALTDNETEWVRQLNVHDYALWESYR